MKLMGEKFDLSLLSGALEVGKPIYLTGLFSGFGGSFFSAHLSYEDAREHAKKICHSMGTDIYRLDFPRHLVHICSDGTECDYSDEFYKEKEREP